MVQHLGLCPLKYSAVLKLEDFDRERTQFLEDIGLSALWRDGLHMNTNVKPSVGNLAEIYYKQLTRDDFNGLLQIYRYDILLGDYEEDVKQLQNLVFK